MTERNGILPVDKGVGPTSHDVVAQARRALRERRIGHTGTLDPFASGLLLLCVGPATRLAEYLTALPKEYLATLRLGATTDTDDLTGAPVAESDAWRELAEPEVRAALEAQAGPRLQLPPRYSAKKVDGERMYAAARRGEEVAREPVPVTIHSLRVLRVDLPEVEFVVECSSGTYIRAIARDAGEALGVGAHLTALRGAVEGSGERAEVVPFSAKIEAELAELPAEDRGAFLESLGLESAGLDRLIRAGFHLLGLQTYFTAGEQEVRAWTIHRGDTAPAAAGVIHSDFERGFIRAETVSYEEFLRLGGWKGAREKGAVRSEGKEYVVQDGDVMLFRFNV